MDFSNRAEWEARLAERLGKIGETQRREIMRLLGDPPRIENIQPDYWTQYRQDLEAVLGRDLEAIYLQSAANFIEANSWAGVDWSLINSAATEWARRYGYDLVSGLTDTTRRGLQELIPQFFERDMTLGELRDRLGQWFGPVRADMIATTEVTRAAVSGEEGVAAELREQGIDMVEVWQTNNDELVCPICGPRNGKARGDGWDSPPPAHPRCRCWVTHELRGAEEEKRDNITGQNTISNPFYDSVIKEPVYHGTDALFDRFDESKIGTSTDEGLLGRGIYFGTDPQVARSSKYRLEVYVNVKKPVTVEMETWFDSKKDLVTRALNIDKNSSARDVTRAAKEQGFDGVVLSYEKLGYPHKEICVFNADQTMILNQQ